MINSCDECLKRQLKIDALIEENLRLKQNLRYRRLKEKEGVFGSSTPSSKIPVKANAPAAAGKPKGARMGHKGKGRAAVAAEDADHVVTLEAEKLCPNCGGAMTDKGFVERTVMESQPVKAQQVVYRLAKGHCPRCRKSIQASPPGVLPRSLYGNQLIVTATAMHFICTVFPWDGFANRSALGLGAWWRSSIRRQNVLNQWLIVCFRNVDKHR